MTLGVRQNRTQPGYAPDWTANVNGVLLRQADGGGKPVFFASGEDAMAAADAAVDGC